MIEIVATAFWKRIDTEGHDCCRLIRTADGWRLDGCAVFDHDGRACALAYWVECDGDWHTRSAAVDGAVGFDALALRIEKGEGGEWLLNGVEQPAARGQIDLDLGFTPATNLIAIRRLSTLLDAETPAPAAYYLEFTHKLGLIEQTYRRTGETTLAYASRPSGYAAELEVSPSGFVTHYPGLWFGKVAMR